MPEAYAAGTRVLVVDDDDDIVNLLLYILEREGYTVLTASNGADALQLTESERPDLIVLDIMMPKMNGIEICRRIRKDAHLRETPILLLTALTEQDDEIKGLDAGADDYITKPIAPRLFLSHVRALLRRANREETTPDLIQVDDLRVDRSRYVVTRGTNGEREEVHMPRKEFELLFFLASHPGRVFTRQELLDHVWGPNVYVIDRTIDVHVRKIREKLGSGYIETVKGVGYKFRS